ncbi:hypothetical protein O6H91_21G061300 [Diphasiastrum complanatum]|uniref:Uncharacterized protein n=1 Tax=Diphasiastrum complanatum TaxID=34168 RepID=A0ACC2AM72_DIPCM|nr:hypothetical protein O6H91_21G061300 [Diphasiastrum complanatum]
MDRSPGGIQQLLVAEQEAQSIVANARNAKMARLRQAKEEAEREVAAFRVKLENDFRKKLAESSGDTGVNKKRLDIETVLKIQHLESEASKVSSEVTTLLLHYVTTVKI